MGKMDVPYVFVKSKARLGLIVRRKTTTTIALRHDPSLTDTNRHQAMETETDVVAKNASRKQLQQLHCAVTAQIELLSSNPCDKRSFVWCSLNAIFITIMSNIV